MLKLATSYIPPTEACEILDLLYKDNNDSKANDVIVMAKTAIWEKSRREHPGVLTYEALCKMDGEPVWINGWNVWGIVSVNNKGVWKDIPFVVGDGFNWNVMAQNLLCYRYKPKRAMLNEDLEKG